MYHEKLTNVLAAMQRGKILTKKGDRYSPATLQNFNTALSHIAEFEHEQRRQSTTPDTVQEYFQELQIFLVSKGFAKNTVATMLENTRAVMRHIKAISVPKLEHVPTELTTAIYTTTEEQEKLSALDLGKSTSTARIRDVYILHCNIGVRFGDLQKILGNLENFILTENDRQYFRLKTKKVGVYVVIPINRIATEILRKRNYNLGEIFSLTYYNRVIHDLGQLAGFTEPICRYVTKGGRMTESFQPKWQFMSSHTARRSFATNAYLNGVPESDIMQITGHNTITAFRKYVRADALQKARSLADHPFFK